MEYTAKNEIKEATYTSPNGRVRVFYRTEMTAADDFNRAFMESKFVGDDGLTIKIEPKTLARFCLETFCNRIELLDEAGKVERTFAPFTWDVLQSIAGIHAEGGWSIIVALEINRKVLGKSLEDAEELKKASPSPSDPGSLDGGPVKTPAAPTT